MPRSTYQSEPPEQTPRLLTGGLKSPATHENGSGLVVSIDWVEVTFHPDQSLEIPAMYAFLYAVDPGRAMDYSRWLAYQDFKDQVLQVASIMLCCDPGDWDPLEHGRNGYRQSLLGPVGSQLQYDAPGGPYFTLVLPGKACQLAGPNFLKSFLVYAIDTGAKFPRIDTAIDDWKKRIEPERFRKEYHGPDAVTHVKKEGHYGESLRGQPENDNRTVYIGSRKSDRFLRIYDKSVESGGKIDAYRLELQERRKFANKAAQQLANDELTTVVPSRLVGFIDFKDHESAAHLDDRTRCQWFEELVVGAKKGAAYDPAPPKNRQEFVDDFERRQRRSLGVVFHHYGGDINRITELAAQGRRDWKPRHHSLANEDIHGIPKRLGEPSRLMNQACKAHWADRSKGQDSR